MKRKTIKLRLSKTGYDTECFYACFSDEPENHWGWIPTAYLKGHPIQKMIDEMAAKNPGYVIQVM